MHKFRLDRLTRSPYSCSHCYKCSTECWDCQSWESVQEWYTVCLNLTGTYFAPHAIIEFGSDVHAGVGLQLVLLV